MRLLQLNDNGEFSLVERLGNDIPRYAILSHTWGQDEEEVTFHDLMHDRGRSKAGYQKLRFCGAQAATDGLKYFWVDTCCIDKSSSADLSEAINSMFRWYKNADRCYVYLSDVSRSSSDGDDEATQRWKPAFRKSRWFTRGWTLQELIAPASVEFFSREGICLGSKESMGQTIHEITGIAIDALQGRSLSQFSTNERLLWAQHRITKREEDAVYSQLGLFDVQMPLLYGEGREKAEKRLYKEIKESSDTMLLSQEQKQKLLDSLRFDQIDARHTTIKSAHARTCKWLLRKSEYIDWLDKTKLSEHHGFLWIKGKPGAGKSTLMKFALANARKRMKDWVVVSFFFNARGEDIEKSTIGTYRSLLLQLLEQLPALQNVFEAPGFSTLSASTGHKWSIESLKTLLEHAVQGLGKSSVVCFIDALDECEENQIRDMVSFFERIGELATSSGIRFQVCFSSRHYPHITIRKGLDLVLEGQEGHTQDITSYLESELKIGKTKVAQQVRDEVQEKAAGVFMWVVLVTDILNKEHDRGRMFALRQRLKEIPRDLHELFRDILTRDSERTGELVLCIQWVLFAKQPLSPEQLYFAILSGIRPDEMSKHDPEENTSEAIKRFVLDSSKGLVETTTSKVPKVQFIHESVRDFLLKEDGLSNIWPDLRSNLQGKSHEQLKQCCLRYMSIDVFTLLRVPESLPKASSPQATELRKSAADSFPFLEYATHHVLYHANTAQGTGISQTSFLDSFLLPRWVKLDNLLQKHEIRRHSASVSLLYLLGEYNLANLIGIHQSVVSCVEPENERYGCAVFSAMATNSKNAVKMFMDHLVIDHSPGINGLRLDAQNHYEECDQKSIEFNFQFSKNKTVFSYSVELGYERIASFLIAAGKFDVNWEDKDEQTSFSWAARNGSEAVVKMLLDTGRVDVESKDSYGRTPLSWAAQNGSEAVVKMLLDTGKVNVNSKDSNGQTPLLRAAENRYEAVVKMLLETGKVDVDSKGKDGQTLLLWAVQNGREAVVKMLLDTGKVDVESKDGYGRTPLSWAASNGREAMFKLLLDTGKVDVESKDSYGRTPLLWAAQNGREASVRLLLDTGKVDVNSKDSYGRTPLLWAAENRHEAVVKMLLDTGKVDVDLKDSSGQTPLLWAASNGSEAVAKLLRSYVNPSQ